MKVFNNKFILGLAVVALFLAIQPCYAGFNLFQSQPNSVFVNTPTQVKFIADIAPNATLIKQSVNLLRQTPTGWKVIGAMHDDGLLGDALANDNKFTLQVSLNEPNITQLAFQVSAAYKGIVRRDQSATIFVDVVAGNSLQISAGQSEMTILLGQSASTSFTLEIFNQGGVQANLTALESINPPSGLGLVSDYPSGGWSTNATNKTFLVQNTFTGNQIGDYEVILTGTLNLNGGIEQTAKILVHVTDASGIGKLSLTAWPSGLQTGAPPQSVSFSAEYSQGDKTPQSVALDEVDVQGNLVWPVGAMHDDGVDPDLAQGDLVYSTEGQLTAGTQPTTHYFRATAVFDNAATIQSPIFALPVLPYPIGFVTPDSTYLVQDPTSGQKFFCNQVLAIFKEGSSLAAIEAAVNSIAGAKIVGVEPQIRSYQIEIPCNGTSGVYAAIGVLQQNPVVESASPNGVSSIGEVNPNDPGYATSPPPQWAPQKVRADEAWVIARGGPVIAILDTGVDYNHEDLIGKVIKGKDFVNNDNDPQDDHSHGTHVAGIAAATGNNGKGIAGIVWDSKILAIKVCDSNGSCPFSAQVSGLNYAVQKGAKVVNLSIYGYANNAQQQAAIAQAVLNGRLVVAIAGNDSTSNTSYPCSFAGVLCVGNTTTTDGKAGTSNFGTHVDIAAPGENIYSTIPGSSYGFKSGTSMAAPLVSGIAALVWQRYPTWTYGQVSDRLIKTGVPLTGLQIGPRVDAFEAVFNGSFEHELSGWKTSGTASALDNLGPISPTAGKKMGMASSGPDATVSQSELYQEFTIQPGVTTIPIQFNYAMITEEYPEYVGSIFNDNIVIQLETPSGTQQLAVETVNGSSFSPIGGIDFPGGDSTVGWTGWKSVNVNVSVPPGGGTFRLRVRDEGDGIFDTDAILDNIRFK